MMRFLSLLLLDLCPCVVFVVMWSFWYICKVVVVPYVAAVAAVMCVLLLVLYVCMLRECEGAMVTAMLVWRTGEVWVG